MEERPEALLLPRDTPAVDSGHDPHIIALADIIGQSHGTAVPIPLGGPSSDRE